MRDTIYEVGKKLNVTEKEINAVKNAGDRSRNGKREWLLSGLISVISFIVGFFTGGFIAQPAPGGYPYAAGLTASVGSTTRRKGIRMLLTLLPIITFLFGTLLGSANAPTYPASTRYGVYGQEGTRNRG